MSSKKLDADAGGGEAINNDTGMSPPAVAAQFPSAAAAALAGLTGANVNNASNLHQFSNILDPTNALLAAVAASAMQQRQQQQQHSNPANHSAAQLAAARALLGAGAGNGSMNARTIAALLTGQSAANLQGNSAAPTGAIRQQVLTTHQQVVADAVPSGTKPKKGSGVSSGGSKRMTSSASGSLSSMLVPNMHAWDVQKLEQHVKLLQQMNQPVPQSVALLLADARRKEEKRAAKRVANRKSACTSRARKKALVEEMTKTNARLKRQAMILSLLPDLVIAISPEGEITFCSAQVERCLQYKPDELLGAKLSDLLVPASRTELTNVIAKLMGSDEEEKSSSNEEAREDRGAKRNRSDNDQQASTDTNTNNSGGSADQHSGETAAAIVSEQSFPLSVVQVESNQSGRRAGAAAAKANDSANSSDNSTNNESGIGKQRTAVSSLTGTNSTHMSRSPTGSSLGEDADAKVAAKPAKRPGGSSDDSSSLSSDAKNMRKANDNLDRNVRWHNQRIMNDDKSVKLQNGPKDDVTGASVTANNATARLSSLQHLPGNTVNEPNPKRKKTSLYERGDQSSSDESLLAGVEEKKKEEKANASDDSGYRESNDSREAEETSSSSSATSESNAAQKARLVPTCRMCLIRDDMTTVWCEVTSSIRSHSTDEQDLSDSQSPAPSLSGGESPDEVKADFKELLLCLRPIRDGEKLVDESLRFVRPKKKTSSEDSSESERMVSETSGAAKSQDSNSDKSGKGSSESTDQSSGSSSKEAKKKVSKKRTLPRAQSTHGKKKKLKASTSEDVAEELPAKSVTNAGSVANTL